MTARPSPHPIPTRTGPPDNRPDHRRPRYLVFRAKNRGTTTAHVESCRGCPSDYDSYREHDVNLVAVAP